MKHLINSLRTPLARTSAFYYFGNFALVFSRYLFHLVLLRLLAPAQYGEFLSYLSLIYLLGIPTGTVANVVTKYVSDFRGKGDFVAINRFFYYLLKLISPISLTLAILLIIFSGPFAHLFKANSIAFVILGISVIVSLFQSIVSSYIVAFQKFIYQTIINLLGVVITVALSVFFINLDFGATGAVLAQILSGVVITLLLFIPLKHQLIPSSKVNKSSFNLKDITGYSFIYALGTASLISTDVLLVRILFDSTTSGLYSSLSILGRMILFGLSPLIALILPIAAHRHSQNNATKSVLLKLGSVILLFGTIGASIFSFFPTQAIIVLSGSAYLPIAPLLPYVAFSMAFLAYSEFILTYLFATGRFRSSIFLLITTFFQPTLIYIFRSNLSSVVIANFALQLTQFLSLSLYTLIKRK